MDNIAVQWHTYVFISEGADYIFGFLLGKEGGDTLFLKNCLNAIQDLSSLFTPSE